jgi:hypothetical protein
MRATVLFLLFLVTLGAPAVGRAEKVRTNQPTNLLSRPGERANVIVKVKEGQAMTVLAKESRWLKVRVSGRTGWVPRSKVDATEEIVRNTRRRSFVDGRGTKRGFNGEEGPEDRVGADALGQTEGRSTDEDEEPAPKKKKPAVEEEEEEEEEPPAKVAKKGKPAAKKPDPKTKPAKAEKVEDEDDISVDDEEEAPKTAAKPASSGGDAEDDEPADERPQARVKAKTVAYAEPDAESDESFPATPNTPLFPTGAKKGKFTEVENEEGDLGYVLTSSLASDDGEGGGVRTRQIDVRARIGFSFFQQGLRTPNAPVGVPNNYNISTSAATLALGGALLYPYKARFLVGGEVSYDYAKAIPGLKEMDGTTTSVGLHKLQVRGLFGYDLKKKSGMMLFGRLGLHYQSYQVADADNLAKNTATLPSEIITAPAIGAALAIPGLTPKIGLRFSVDAILFGASVKQTKNLEDGADPSAKAFLVGAGLVYRLSKFDLQVTYDLNYYRMSFGAMVPTSQRMHMGGNVSRTDSFHALTVGAAKAF